MKLKIRPLSGVRATALLAFAVALLALIAGCNKDPNTGNSPEGAKSNLAPASASPPANTSSAANTPPPASAPVGPSPTEAVKGYYEAGKRKDIAGIKRFLSRQSLRLMEDVAKRQGKTPDQLFAEAADMDARKPPPVFGGERIGGNTAFVDIKTPGEPVRTVPLVKEGGEWKLEFGNPKSGAIKR
jgi:hypothetical protein